MKQRLSFIAAAITLVFFAAAMPQPAHADASKTLRATLSALRNLGPQSFGNVVAWAGNDAPQVPVPIYDYQQAEAQILNLAMTIVRPFFGGCKATVAPRSTRGAQPIIKSARLARAWIPERHRRRRRRRALGATSSSPRQRLTRARRLQKLCCSVVLQPPNGTERVRWRVSRLKALRRSPQPGSCSTFRCSMRPARSSATSRWIVAEHFRRTSASCRTARSLIGSNSRAAGIAALPTIAQRSQAESRPFRFLRPGCQPFALRVLSTPTGRRGCRSVGSEKRTELLECRLHLRRGIGQLGTSLPIF